MKGRALLCRNEYRSAPNLRTSSQQTSAKTPRSYDTISSTLLVTRPVQSSTLGVTPSQKTKDLSHRHRPHPRPYSLRLVLIFVRRHVSPQVLGNLRASSQISQSVSHLFHGPAPRSPLHRLAVRLRHSPSPGLTVTRKYRVLAPGARGGYSNSQIRS